MNTRTKTPSKKAGAGRRPAERYKLQNRTYSKSAQLSNLKMFIGEVLLFGNKQRKEFWWFLDSKVRQFYDLKIYEGKQ